MSPNVLVFFQGPRPQPLSLLPVLFSPYRSTWAENLSLILRWLPIGEVSLPCRTRFRVSRFSFPNFIYMVGPGFVHLRV